MGSHSQSPRLKGGRYSRPEIKCPCGKLHTASPAALATIIRAFYAGDMQTVRGGELVGKCMVEALADPSIIEHHADKDRKIYAYE